MDDEPTFGIIVLGRFINLVAFSLNFDVKLQKITKITQSSACSASFPVTFFIQIRTFLFLIHRTYPIQDQSKEVLEFAAWNFGKAIVSVSLHLEFVERSN